MRFGKYEYAAPIDARQFLMYIVRPLDHPKGWLIGASFRSSELTKLFAQAALGYNPVVALVDTKRADDAIEFGARAQCATSLPALIGIEHEVIELDAVGIFLDRVVDRRCHSEAAILCRIDRNISVLPRMLLKRCLRDRR